MDESMRSRYAAQEALAIQRESVNTAYAILEELEEQLAEACSEQTEWEEEIDRQNLRKLLDDLDAVKRVELLIREILDPGEQP